MKIAIVDLTPKDYPIKVFSDVAKNLFLFLKKKNKNIFFSNKIIKKNCLNIVLGTIFLKKRTNFFFFTRINKLPKNTILYNLESYFHKDLWYKKSLKFFYKNYTVVDYSKDNAKKLTNLEINIKENFPIFFNIIEEKKIKKEIDILFIGSINKRRKKILDILKAKGLNVYASDNVKSPQQLKKLILKSKIFLNIHYFGLREIEQVRINPNICTNCIILSEKSLYKSENIFFSKFIKLCKYGELVDEAQNIINNKKNFFKIKKNIYNNVNQNNEKALNKIYKFILNHIS